MDGSDNNLGSFLKQKRKEKGLTLVQLGEKIGVTNGTISKWERGHIKNMKRDKIEALCNVLDIPPLVLINGIENNDKIEIEQITEKDFQQEVFGLLSKHAHIKYTYSTWLFLSNKLLNNVIDLDDNQKKQIISYLELYGDKE